MSESLILDNVEAFLQDAGSLPVIGSFHAERKEILKQVRQLQMQVAQGLHTNPGLVVFGNPKGRMDRRSLHPALRDVRVKLEGLIGDQVHMIRYRHATDGQPYQHDFERNDTGLWAARLVDSRRKVLLIVNEGDDLWKDF